MKTRLEADKLKAIDEHCKLKALKFLGNNAKGNRSNRHAMTDRLEVKTNPLYDVLVEAEKN